MISLPRRRGTAVFNRVEGVTIMTKTILGLLVSGLLSTALIAAPYAALAQDAPKVLAAAKTDGADDAKVETKRPLTAQQLKMKDCGAKWQEEKKAKGVKGRDAWNKFRSDCLKS
jgi:hypothetical protein